jgi:uncharacterized membrane protein YczE
MIMRLGDKMAKITTFLKENRNNIIYYLSGIICLGFAVNIVKASTLGSGAWDTVTINIRDFFNINLGVDWITLGMVSFSVSLIIMMIVLIYRKEIKYLLMILPIFLVALSIDSWNLIVFKDYESNVFLIRLIFYIIGILTLPLGLSLVVKSSFPAFVFDEWMLMMVKVLKAKRITYVRLSIEVLGILIGVVFGYLVYYNLDGSLGAVNIGSLIISVALSPLMALYFRFLKIKTEK